MSVTIIYGSDNGCTRSIADKIAAAINGTAIDITDAQPADMESCSLLILGCPTYADGELQSDWDTHLGKLEAAELSNKRVAIFGTGDQVGFPDSFVDAIGILHDIVERKGAEVIGYTDPAGYDFTKSAALRDGRFVGLALDEDNQSSETAARVKAWLGQLG
ncbi:MAG: flavodoxin FldA [Xanthobacteraceae bacterium]